MDTLETLVAFSRRLGSDPALVQGGGGNTSLKSTDGQMWIKASGLTLREVTTEKGFVAVDDALLRRDLALAHDEAGYTHLIQSAILPTGGEASTLRPSIETGFHALLGRAVLHSHSVWANLITCCADGEAMAARLFPESLWVPYGAPGLPLTQAVAARIDTGSKLCVLFLQNHGLIVSAPTLQEAWEHQQRVGETLRAFFALEPDAFALVAPCDADESHVLFPDQAVYLLKESLRSSRAGAETAQAYSFIRGTLEKKGLAPHYLSPEQAHFLLSMEAEKYRQKVAAL